MAYFSLFQAPTFISPGNNLKLKASIATGHLPCLEKLLEEVEEWEGPYQKVRVLGKQCPLTFVCRGNWIELNLKGENLRD